MREEVEGCGGACAVLGGDDHEDVGGGILCVFHGDIEVAVVCEEAEIGELQLGVARAAAGVLAEEGVVRIGALRVLVEEAEVAGGGGGVLVVVELFHVLAVVAFGAGEAEEALFQDGVLAVPEGEGEAEELVAVAEAGEAVLVPAVGAAAGVVVREVGPRVAGGAVVLADGAPRALGEVRAPVLPAEEALSLLVEALLLGVLVGGALGLRRHRGAWYVTWRGWIEDSARGWCAARDAR
ncbi:MAG: hypothetical protein R3F14_35260 [Polyangiaceae bacterium]